MAKLESSNRVMLRSAFVPDADRPVFDPGGPSLCRQEFADECDVNNIVRKHPNVGLLPPLPGVEPIYYDFTSMPDNLMSSMNMMMEAEEAFMRLPAVTRKEFDNDALRFIEFASSKDNLKRMREWGLAPPEKEPDPPMRVEVVNPPTPPGPAVEPKK